MNDAPCIQFKTPRRKRKSWAAPVSHGRFAFLEMQDRRDVSAGRVSSRKSEAKPDPHREPSVRLLAAWEPIERELCAAVGDVIFRMWLEDDLHAHRLIGGTWTLACSKGKRGWIESRFGALVRAAAGKPCVFVECEVA